MRSGTQKIGSLQRTLHMLEAVLADGGTNAISRIAQQCGIPVATAHRQVVTLVAEGYLRPTGKGRHLPGQRLIALLELVDEKKLIASLARPILSRLAEKTKCVAQLGTFEGDMVTYRVKCGLNASNFFTQVGMQLEAYCSGIGKILLAHLTDADRQAYLAAGPFVPLTERTIVDPVMLAAELERVRARGYATDDREIDKDLYCIAVPLQKPSGEVPAAISLSMAYVNLSEDALVGILSLLREAAVKIERSAFDGAMDASSN